MVHAIGSLFGVDVERCPSEAIREARDLRTPASSVMTLSSRAGTDNVVSANSEACSALAYGSYQLRRTSSLYCKAIISD